MMQRTSSFWVGQFEGIDVVGYKSQFTHIYPTDTKSVKNLFTTEKGEGLNPEMNGEGIKEGGFEGTYLLGPLFVLNPLYMRKFLADLGIDDCTPLYEEAAMEAYKKRLDEYREPGRNYKY
jgi:CobQ-like glutamine amidotransferase family enzyme